MDPLAEKYFLVSPYVYVENNPMLFIDPDGNYKLPANLASKYSKLDNYLRSGIGNLLNQAEIREGLKVIGNFSDEQIDNLATYDKGIEIDILQLDDDGIDHPQGLEINGYTPGDGTIQIDATLAQQLQDASTPEEEQAALLAIISTILHETIHEGNRTNSVPYNRAAREITVGSFSRTYDPKADEYTYFYNGVEVGTSSESGRAFENAIWYNGGTNLNFGWYMKQGEQGLKDQNSLIKENREVGREHVLPNINW